MHHIYPQCHLQRCCWEGVESLAINHDWDQLQGSSSPLSRLDLLPHKVTWCRAPCGTRQMWLFSRYSVSTLSFHLLDILCNYSMESCFHLLVLLLAASLVLLGKKKQKANIYIFFFFFCTWGMRICITIYFYSRFLPQTPGRHLKLISQSPK